MGVVYCQPQKKTKRRRKRFPDPSIIYIGQSNTISIPTYTTNPSGHRHPPRRKTPDLISRLISRRSLLSHQPLRHIPGVGVAAPVTVESGSNTISHSRVESDRIHSLVQRSYEISRFLLGTDCSARSTSSLGARLARNDIALSMFPVLTTPFNWRSAFLGIGLQPPIVDGESGPPSRADDMHVIIPLDSNGDNLDLPNRSSDNPIIPKDEANTQTHGTN
ncbi:hypothetical protein BS47DRAFT_1403023 [Hydnum rufescens UP504]|uniref:Uncharacterized protein n=1 Tax=Hydnum rufescens UP504 TaxID=1448309 RepID=A0A9P6DL94_9AGAM|nr:hypothetical protein BS47DRAFT_1403023 [Hydnum rufescens UP504]